MKNILIENISKNFLSKLGFNTRVKFKSDPKTYYIKNLSADHKSVFVTDDRGIGIWNKQLNNLISINGQPLLENYFFIKESFTLLQEISKPETKKISKQEAEKILKNSKGKTFIVKFVKKDSTPRTLYGQIGVTKYLRGGELPFNPEPKKLLPVYDLEKKDYRIINLNTVYYLKLDNQEYTVR
jgi:hypothetical protein